MTFFETKCMLGQSRWVYLLGNKFFQWVWLEKGLNLTTLGFKRLTQPGEGLLNLGFLKNIVPTQFTTIFHVTLRCARKFPTPHPKPFHNGSVCSSITVFVDCLCWRKWEFHCIKKSCFDYTSVKCSHWQSMQLWVRLDNKDIIVSEQFAQKHKRNTVYSK